MRTFRYRNTTPPGGYRYQIPVEAGGDFVEGGDLMQVVNVVRNIYRRNGKVAPANLAAMIEDYICCNTVESFCRGEYEPGAAQSRLLDVKDVKEEIRALNNVRSKWPRERYLAPLPEAERRAAMCANCTLNVKGFCTTCHGLKGVAAEAVEGRTTSVDSQLGVCSVCSCIIKTKVHVSVEALKAVRKTSAHGVYPESGCWMKEIE